jgi:hypothetical protein
VGFHILRHSKNCVVVFKAKKAMGKLSCTHGKDGRVYDVLIVQREGTRLSEKERLDGSKTMR